MEASPCKTPHELFVCPKTANLPWRSPSTDAAKNVCLRMLPRVGLAKNFRSNWLQEPENLLSLRLCHRRSVGCWVTVARWASSRIMFRGRLVSAGMLCKDFVVRLTRSQLKSILWRLTLCFWNVVALDSAPSLLYALAPAWLRFSCQIVTFFCGKTTFTFWLSLWINVDV